MSFLAVFRLSSHLETADLSPLLEVQFLSSALHLNLHKHQLAVDKIQTFLDKYLKDNSGCIDYIHGEDVLKELSKEEQTIGIELLPSFHNSSELFVLLRYNILFLMHV